MEKHGTNGNGGDSKTIQNDNWEHVVLIYGSQEVSLVGEGEERSILEHSCEGDEGVAVGAAERAGAAHDSHLVGPGRPDGSRDHECPVVLSAIRILQNHGLDAAGHSREVARLDRITTAISELPRGRAHGLRDIEREERARAEVRGERGVEHGQERVGGAQRTVHLDVHKVLEHEWLVRRLARLDPSPGNPSRGAKEQCEHEAVARDEGSHIRFHMVRYGTCVCVCVCMYVYEQGRSV